ncbi:bifunctional aminoglycoside phosphotransferase/ATP-binding protein [Nocardia vinacea]|uniref:bifunctional aminoglycoside phosphotransferase/ATP-binding protein n=1 Tax=Nocardia vinacea TaxID=96468 RepID=UPI000686F73C|nr:bifunctional aminoglycoside phosphotransferase/ATP-binding protein [Nocardia vinacea]
MAVTAAAPAQLRETHTGVVVLCGDRAYKTKKPIATDFLNFSTTELRERACAREVELNRRLAPDVYLGIAHLTDPTGGPDEPVIVMRRMPEDRRLSNILADPNVRGSELSALVQVLTLFHQTTRRGPEIDRAGTPEELRARWRVLVHSLTGQSADIVEPAQLARIDELAMRYIDGRNPLLANRIADCRIVDGHGDLLAEDIFDLTDGFRVLDCLDFDDRLRYLDCLDDIAFLAMDLEFLGHRELGDRLLDDYLRATADPAPISLRDHYIAYRALVRAKVDVIRFGQGDTAAPEHAHRHLQIAVRHLEQAAVRLVLVGGLPGTGKSTVAADLSLATGAVVISSDHVRKQLLAGHELTGSIGTYDAGAYAPAGKARVYAEMLAEARALLGSGVSVVLDASWIDATERQRAAALAEETYADLIQLRCVCPRAVASGRIRQRAGCESDATPDIADAMAEAASSWTDAVALDTTLPLEHTAAAAMCAWQPINPEPARDLRHQTGAYHRHIELDHSVV